MGTANQKLEDLFGKNSSFTDMSSTEKGLFAEILKEEIERRKEASKPKQVRDIMPIEDWINSEYMIGPDVHSIYPYWKDFVTDIFSSKRTNENKINSVILGGSIGIGKSTVAEIIMLRKMYELSCFKNINALFHLMSKTNIMFLYFSVNKTQAVNTGYGEFRSLVDRSPYFLEHFPRRKHLDSILVFPEGVTFAYGSRSSDAIGMSVICAMLDEANFISGNGSNSSGNAERALDMYAGIVNRANSRFIMDGGVNHSLNILVSSSTHESSATERQMNLSRNDPHTIISSPSQWEVKPEKFSKKFFWVCRGNDSLEPMIVNSTDDVNDFRLSEGLHRDKDTRVESSYEAIKNEIEKLPPHMQDRFIQVPVDLKHGFEINIIRSLQDLAGIPISAGGKLFTSPLVYNQCIVDTMVHPFISQEIVISTGDDIQVRDYLRPDFRLEYPERKRYMHIDQSTKTDSTGIASVYISDVIEEDGVRKPVFSVDFVLRINPPKPPKKIAIYKIRNFVVYLSQVLGVRFGKVTYDIFNSEESRQILEEMGLNVGYQSVDRSDKAYLDLVEIIYEKRLRLYDYPILRHELFNLIHYRDRRKVDHPKVVTETTYTGKGSEVGSKDASDALCVSYDTKIFLVSGKVKTIEDLYYKHYDSEWIIAYDIENDKYVSVEIKEIIQKGVIPETLIELTFDNGESVTLTDDHLVLMSNLHYKKAVDIKCSDSVLSFEPDLIRDLKGVYYKSRDAHSEILGVGYNKSINKYRTVVCIRRKFNDKYVYDIRLDQIHNFGISAGVFVHNCGAVQNALQATLSDGVDGGHTLDDFMRINNYRSGFEPDITSVDKMIDKQIDDMIEDMEMSGVSYGESGYIGLRGF